MNKELSDRVWKILPKEFKEEVKKLAQYYSRHVSALFGMERQRADKFYHEFVSLFGYHILTSDADEEEELLYVSRKQVQKMYSYNEEELTKDPTNKGALLLKLRLDALFGSKCLPDGNEDNFASKEQEHDYTPNGCTHPNKENCRWKDKGLDCNLKNGCYYEPKPAEPKKKRHVSVKEACEILGVDESEATTLVKSKPIETCTDDCSSPDHFVVKDEMVDNIIKDGFKNHNRLNIAAMAMQGILSNIDLFKNVLETGMETLGGDGISFRAVAKSSFLFADALINEAEEGDSK